MARGNWIREAREAGRLTSDDAPWEIIIPNDTRRSRASFPHEQEAIIVANEILAEGDLPFVEILKNGEPVYRIAPDLDVPIGTEVSVSGTTFTGVVQNRAGSHYNITTRVKPETPLDDGAPVQLDETGIVGFVWHHEGDDVIIVSKVAIIRSITGEFVAVNPA